VPANGKARPVENLARLDDEALAKRLDTPNGTVRDLVHRELVHRAPGTEVRDELQALLLRSLDPAVRLHALSVLDGVGLLDASDVRQGLGDSDPRVRAHAVRLCETLTRAPASLLLGSNTSEDTPDVARDDDPLVRFQLALTLGELRGEEFGQTLATIAERNALDPWLRAAVLSSTATHGVTLLARQLAMLSPTDDAGGLIPDVAATVAATAPEKDLPRLAKALRATASAPTRFVLLESLLASLERRGVGFAKLEPRGKDASRRVPSDLEAVLSDARKAAIDGAQHENTRIAAIRLLGRASTATSTPSTTLTELISAKQPVAIQKAAIEGLARSRSREAGETLVAALLELTPANRGVALDAIVSREAWTSALLDAVQRRDVLPSALSAAHRERLLRHESVELRRRAERVLVDVRPVARKKALDSFRSALELVGDDRRGAAVFTRLCATCHEFRGQGTSIGASLAALQDRAPAALLVAILDPNAAVESKFESYDVVTRDGRVRSGLLKNETATALTLVTPSGEEERLLRSDVVRLRSSRRSMMPEGLETSMTRQDLADLMVFLRGG
jgi:putative heme-binding domain-containing protein